MLNQKEDRHLCQCMAVMWWAPRGDVDDDEADVVMSATAADADAD